MALTNRLLGFVFLAAIAAAVSACAQPSVQECGATGVLCPKGFHCAAAQGICLPDTNTCGDAHLDTGEVCDDGNTKGGDGCSADCKSHETCGNKIIDSDAGEVCDDGNHVDGDGCSADCKSNESCGNNKIDHAVGEACDPPGPNCSADCRSTLQCNNDKLDPGEECDVLGFVDDARDCRSDCLFNRCGDGYINSLGGPGHPGPIEQCDD